LNESDPPDPPGRPEKQGSYRPPIPGRVNLRTGADNSPFPPLPPPPPPEQRVWTTPLTIGVLADTHMPSRGRDLPYPVAGVMRTVDLILHAGDLTTLDVLERLRRLGPPVLAVHGNVDMPDVARLLPERRIVEVGPWRIGIIHGDSGVRGTTPERARRAFTDVDCVIFGHSHQPLNERLDGVLLFNPGSPTDRRTAPTFSYGILRVTDEGITGEIIRFQRD
jgi:putative phosphoesterase